MSADVIQFVPRPRVSRVPLFNRKILAPREVALEVLDPMSFNAALHVYPDFSQAGAYHGGFTAPDKDAG